MINVTPTICHQHLTHGLVHEPDLPLFVRPNRREGDSNVQIIIMNDVIQQEYLLYEPTHSVPYSLQIPEKIWQT